MSAVPRQDQDQTLDALIERYVADVRAGHAPSVDAIADAHPDLADELRVLLPAAAAVERVAVQPNAATDSPPGLEIQFEIAPGSGGMGRVYAARETSLDRIVAVKTIQEHMQTPEGREFFVREAKAAANLDHPNIVKVFRFDPDHAPPYFVMQYVDGQPLNEACKGRDAVLIARIVEQVARGLAYAHDQGIVHRDIKPANVLVTADGVPHITDFGLAKSVDGTVTGDINTSSMKGTPSFIAPEVYEGQTNPGPSVDIYALGVTLYELLCDQQAFPGASLAEVRSAVIANEPELPQTLAPHIPEPLQRICLMAIEKLPEDRYSSALEMAEDLRRFCTGDAVKARPKRYRRAARGMLQTQMTEIRLWRAQRIISVQVADRLLRPYRLTLHDDSPWGRLSKNHPFATTALRLGVVMLLISSLLWPVYYWSSPSLSPALRVFAVGAPTVLINAVGWTFHVRGNRPNAAAFLSTGTLLVPLFVASMLIALGLPATAQSRSIELFRIDESGRTFTPTNVQIALSMLALLWYSGFAMLRAHVRVLSIWTGAACYLYYGSLLLVCGMKEPLTNDHVAIFMLAAIPATLALVYVSYSTRKLADGAWSTIFFVGFPLPFAVLLTLLARFATEEWLDAGSAWNEVELQVLLMLNGGFYLLAALLCRRGWSSAVRFWSPYFLGLLAVSLITPAHVAFDDGELLVEGAVLAELAWLLEPGGKSITAFELVAFVAPVAFVAIGTKLRRGTLVVPALLGFAAFLVHFTDRHFGDDADLAWALKLAVLGAGTMIVSTIVALVIDRGTKSPKA